MIEAFRKAHPHQTKILIHTTNQHISATSNSCLDLASGDYVALLDHDDRLYPNALAEIVRYINLFDQPEILYSDECTIDEKGNRIRLAYHKPQWSPFMHLTMNYTTHLSVYRRSLLQKIGGFRVGFEGSQDHDLMLRAVESTSKHVVHVPFNLYQWRAHTNSTAMSQDHKPYAADAGVRAVSQALTRRGRPGSVSFNAATLQYRVKYHLLEKAGPLPAAAKSPPLISIIIPSKDSPQLLKRCLDSVFQKTKYPNYEVIISDNGTTHSDTLALYQQWSQDFPSTFRVIEKRQTFNFGAQINLGAETAKGEYYLLLNNDTEVIEPDWVDEMISLAQFAEVGAVGCKLLFSNHAIQHAGVSLSAEMIAEHIGLGRGDEDNQYWNYHNTVHEVSAVTAACLLVAKSKFWEVGGFDSTYLPRAYGDVDFCLALREKGYSNLYTPFSKLFHHESASRGRSIEYFERFYLQSRRGFHLSADPYLNPNYTRHPRFEVNPFYTDLDLDHKEFAQLLKELGKTF
jgi:GT2 family glycosyltransferase